DMDGDGLADVIPNGMGGDGPNNDRIDAGEFYIISGAALLAHGQGGQPQATPDATEAAADMTEAAPEATAETVTEAAPDPTLEPTPDVRG
ncbi:MAG: hypothetical protein GXY36_03955, partial [Chloroflexi bacterium]|nr:hypothetical protein [Chloroflexota bacterium]